VWGAELKIRSEKDEGRIVKHRPASTNSSLRPSHFAPRRPIEVGAGLIFRAAKLLITQRYDGAHLGGLWEFPGGKREPGESFEQCLARELREELGVEVVVGQLFEEITHEYPEKMVHLQFFACRLAAGEPQPLGCAAVKWIGQAELNDYAFPAADATLLRKLKSAPNLWRAS
jgi:mutator protein MutT